MEDFSNKKRVIKIYRIDESHISLEPYRTKAEVVAKIMEDRGFHLQNIHTGEYPDFKFLCYFRQEPSPAKWKEFLFPITKKNRKDLDFQEDPICQAEDTYARFVLFIYNEKNIYAISGGVGSNIFSQYGDSLFGVEVLEYLIDPEDIKLKKLSDHDLVGIAFANSQFFRGEQPFNNRELGKIWNDVLTSIDSKTLNELLGIGITDNRNVIGCKASDSLQINESLSFEKFIDLIRHIEKLKDNPTRGTINKIRRIPKKNSKKDILDQVLLKNLYENYKNKNDSMYEICFFKEYEKYFQCEQQTLYFPRSVDSDFKRPFDRGVITRLQTFFELMPQKGLGLVNKDEFELIIMETRIRSHNAEGSDLEARFWNHLHSEVSYDGRNYFFFGGDWYEYDTDFIKHADEHASEVMKNRLLSSADLKKIGIPEIKWKYDEGGVLKSEGKYNLEYEDEGCWVLDDVKPDGIELCDVMHVKDDKLYLMHVKRGFSTSMRDLTLQVEVALKFLINERNNNTNLRKIRRIFDSAQRRKKPRKMHDLKMEDIESLFREKKIVFCMCILDDRKTKEKNLLNMSEFNSNIAKIAVSRLDSVVRQFNNVDLKVMQIWKDK